MSHEQEANAAHEASSGGRRLRSPPAVGSAFRGLDAAVRDSSVDMFLGGPSRESALSSFAPSAAADTYDSDEEALAEMDANAADVDVEAEAAEFGTNLSEDDEEPYEDNSPGPEPCAQSKLMVSPPGSQRGTVGGGSPIRVNMAAARERMAKKKMSSQTMPAKFSNEVHASALLRGAQQHKAPSPRQASPRQALGLGPDQFSEHLDLPTRGVGGGSAHTNTRWTAATSPHGAPSRITTSSSTPSTRRFLNRAATSSSSAASTGGVSPQHDPQSNVHPSVAGARARLAARRRQTLPSRMSAIPMDPGHIPSPSSQGKDISVPMRSRRSIDDLNDEAGVSGSALSSRVRFRDVRRDDVMHVPARRRDRNLSQSSYNSTSAPNSPRRTDPVVEERTPVHALEYAFLPMASSGKPPLVPTSDRVVNEATARLERMSNPSLGSMKDGSSEAAPFPQLQHVLLMQRHLATQVQYWLAHGYIAEPNARRAMVVREPIRAPGVHVYRDGAHIRLDRESTAPLTIFQANTPALAVPYITAGPVPRHSGNAGQHINTPTTNPGTPQSFSSVFARPGDYVSPPGSGRNQREQRELRERELPSRDRADGSTDTHASSTVGAHVGHGGAEWSPGSQMSMTSAVSPGRLSLGAGLALGAVASQARSLASQTGPHPQAPPHQLRPNPGAYYFEVFISQRTADLGYRISAGFAPKAASTHGTGGSQSRTTSPPTASTFDEPSPTPPITGGSSSSAGTFGWTQVSANRSPHARDKDHAPFRSFRRTVADPPTAAPTRRSSAPELPELTEMDGKGHGQPAQDITGRESGVDYFSMSSPKAVGNVHHPHVQDAARNALRVMVQDDHREQRRSSGSSESLPAQGPLPSFPRYSYAITSDTQLLIEGVVTSPEKLKPAQARKGESPSGVAVARAIEEEQEAWFSSGDVMGFGIVFWGGRSTAASFGTHTVVAEDDEDREKGKEKEKEKAGGKVGVFVTRNGHLVAFHRITRPLPKSVVLFPTITVERVGRAFSSGVSPRQPKMSSAQSAEHLSISVTADTSRGAGAAVAGKVKESFTNDFVLLRATLSQGAGDNPMALSPSPGHTTESSFSFGRSGAGSASVFPSMPNVGVGFSFDPSRVVRTLARKVTRGSTTVGAVTPSASSRSIASLSVGLSPRANAMPPGGLQLETHDVDDRGDKEVSGAQGTPGIISAAYSGGGGGSNTNSINLSLPMASVVKAKFKAKAGQIKVMEDGHTLRFIAKHSFRKPPAGPKASEMGKPFSIVANVVVSPWTVHADPAVSPPVMQSGRAFGWPSGGSGFLSTGGGSGSLEVWGGSRVHYFEVMILSCMSTPAMGISVGLAHKHYPNEKRLGSSAPSYAFIGKGNVYGGPVVVTSSVAERVRAKQRRRVMASSSAHDMADSPANTNATTDMRPERGSRMLSSRDSSSSVIASDYSSDSLALPPETTSGSAYSSPVSGPPPPVSPGVAEEVGETVLPSGYKRKFLPSGFGEGDVIGCGLVVVKGCTWVYYTKNGKFLGLAFKLPENAPRSGKHAALPPTPQRGPPALYPAVGLSTHGEWINVNMGTRPFLFQISSLSSVLGADAASMTHMQDRADRRSSDSYDPRVDALIPRSYSDTAANVAMSPQAMVSQVDSSQATPLDRPARPTPLQTLYGDERERQITTEPLSGGPSSAGGSSAGAQLSNRASAGAAVGAGAAGAGSGGIRGGTEAGASLSTRGEMPRRRSGNMGQQKDLRITTVPEAVTTSLSAGSVVHGAGADAGAGPAAARSGADDGGAAGATGASARAAKIMALRAIDDDIPSPSSPQSPRLPYNKATMSPRERVVQRKPSSGVNLPSSASMSSVTAASDTVFSGVAPKPRPSTKSSRSPDASHPVPGASANASRVSAAPQIAIATIGVDADADADADAGMDSGPAAQQLKDPEDVLRPDDDDEYEQERRDSFDVNAIPVAGPGVSRRPPRASRSGSDAARDILAALSPPGAAAGTSTSDQFASSLTSDTPPQQHKRQFTGLSQVSSVSRRSSRGGDQVFVDTDGDEDGGDITLSERVSPVSSLNVSEAGVSVGAVGKTASRLSIGSSNSPGNSGPGVWPAHTGHHHHQHPQHHPKHSAVSVDYSEASRTSANVSPEHPLRTAPYPIIDDDSFVSAASTVVLEGPVDYGTAPTVAATSSAPAAMAAAATAAYGVGAPAAAAATSSAPLVSPATSPHNLAPIKWSQLEVIGEGAFGKVYKGFNEEQGSYLAAKQIKLGKQFNEEMQQNVDKLRREIGLMQSLDHPHIVQYLGAQIEKDPDTNEICLFILQELMPQGSLQTAMKQRKGGFWEVVVRRYTKQVLSGLVYLHENNVIHRDIKGANLLLDQTGVIKLADFGASRRTDLADGAKSVTGTPFWMAPEVIKGEGHGPAADIWSVGCTVIELATGKPPWSNLNPVQAMFAIASGDRSPALPKNFSPEGVAFVKRCMDRNPRARPTAKELLQDPWMTIDLSTTPKSIATPASAPAVAAAPMLSPPTSTTKAGWSATAVGGETAAPLPTPASAPVPLSGSAAVLSTTSQLVGHSRVSSTSSQQGSILSLASRQPQPQPQPTQQRVEQKQQTGATTQAAGGLGPASHARLGSVGLAAAPRAPLHADDRAALTDHVNTSVDADAYTASVLLRQQQQQQRQQQQPWHHPRKQ